jgi:hypothetical protein
MTGRGAVSRKRGRGWIEDGRVRGPDTHLVKRAKPAKLGISTLNRERWSSKPPEEGAGSPVEEIPQNSLLVPIFATSIGSKSTEAWHEEALQQRIEEKIIRGDAWPVSGRTMSHFGTDGLMAEPRCRWESGVKQPW